MSHPHDLDQVAENLERDAANARFEACVHAGRASLAARAACVRASRELPRAAATIDAPAHGCMRLCAGRTMAGFAAAPGGHLPQIPT